MRGWPFRVYLPVILYFVSRLRQVTPTVTDLRFFHWCTEKHGEFIAHPLECSKFIRCSHNQAYVFQCGANLRWNQAIKTCDWEQRTKCFLHDTTEEVNAAIGDVKKKSVKRDTSLQHTEIYLSSRESTGDSPKVTKLFGSNTTTFKDTLNASKSTTQEFEKTNVIEYPINPKPNDVVLPTTLKSIFNTPCTNNSHIQDVKNNVSVSSNVNNITENVKRTDSTTSNNFEYGTSTEAVNVGVTINSNDSHTELSTEDPFGNLNATRLSLHNINDIMDKEDESFGEFFSNDSLQDDTTTTTETLTGLMTTPQQSYETMINTELPDISNEIPKKISTEIISVPISVLTEMSTETTVTATSLTENQQNNEWIFSNVTNDYTNDELLSTKSQVLNEITDNNVKLTEDVKTDFIYTTVVTESHMEISLTTTEHKTYNDNTMLTNSVDIKEQTVTDRNVKLTDNNDNNEFIFTTAVTATENVLYVETTVNDKSMLDNSVDITEYHSNLSELPPSSTKIPKHVDDFSEHPSEDMTTLPTVIVTKSKPSTVLTEDLRASHYNLTKTMTDLPTNFTKISKNLNDSSEIAREVTSKDIETSTESLTNSKPTRDVTNDSTELFTDSPDNVTEQPTNIVKTTKSVDDSSDIPTDVTNDDIKIIATESLTNTNPTTVLTEALTVLLTGIPDNLTESLTELPPYIIKITKKFHDSTGLPTEVTNEDMDTSTESLTNSKPTQDPKNDLPKHLTDTPDNLTEATSDLPSNFMKITKNVHDSSEFTREVNTENMEIISTESLSDSNPTSVPTEDLTKLLTAAADNLTETTTELPSNETKVPQNVNNSSEIAREFTSDDVIALTTKSVADSTTTTDSTENLTKPLTDTPEAITELPSNLTKIPNNIDVSSEIPRDDTSFDIETLSTESLTSENLPETSNIAVTDNTMSAVKLIHEILEEKAYTLRTRIPDFVTEMSSGVREQLTETPTNDITTNSDFIADSTISYIMLNQDGTKMPDFLTESTSYVTVKLLETATNVIKTNSEYFTESAKSTIVVNEQGTDIPDILIETSSDVTEETSTETTTMLTDQGRKNQDILTEMLSDVNGKIPGMSTNVFETNFDLLTDTTTTTIMLNEQGTETPNVSTELNSNDVTGKLKETSTNFDFLTDSLKTATILSEQGTEIQDFLTETLSDVTGELTETSQNVITTNSEYFTDSTKSAIMLNELGTEITQILTDTSSDVKEPLMETSTNIMTTNSEFLSDSLKTTTILNEQETEILNLITETSSDVTEKLTETSTNVITTNTDFSTDSTKTNIILNEQSAETTTQINSLDNVYTTINSVELTEVLTQENVWTNVNRGNTEPTLYIIGLTEMSTDKSVVRTFTDEEVTDEFGSQDDFTDTVINDTPFTEPANIIIEYDVNTTLGVATTTYSDSVHEATEEKTFTDSSLVKSGLDKIETPTPITDYPVTDIYIISDLNSDANIILTTATVIPSTVITDSVAVITDSITVTTDSVTKTTESVAITNDSVIPEKYKDHELNSDLVEERLLEVTPTVNSMLLPSIETEVTINGNVNNNLTSTAPTTALNPTPDGGYLSNDFIASSTTIDPRLPYRSPACQGANNNRQFKASKCSQYYQCFAGWAFLLNCYEGHHFVSQAAKCIEDINRECNE